MLGPTVPAKARLILVDDHPLILEGLRRVLEPDFEIVGSASDGRDLLGQVVGVRPDAVVLDIGMPGLNGIEAALHVRSLAPSVKLVFVTQMDDCEYVRRAFHAGASAYVLKQSATTELATALRTALSGRFYISPAVARGYEAWLNDRTNPIDFLRQKLTPRQREVLQLIAEGKSGKEVAAALSISARTVEFHRNAIMEELGMRSTAELTRYALRNGIIQN